MVDKLLQGEKFSSAAYSGAKTGAMAYAAGQIGKAVRGDQAQQAASAAGGMDADQTELAKYILKYYSPEEFDYVPSGTNINVVSKATGQLMANYDVSDVGLFPDEFLAGINKLVAADPSAALGSAASTAARTARDAAFDAEYPNFESRDLTRKQVQAIFERVARLNNRMLSEGRLQEGIWDDIKSGAGKGLQGIKSLAGKAAGAVAQSAAKVGRSMTAKVSSDALTKAWEKAGKPTDSVEIEKLLQAQGVNPEVISTVFKANNIPVSTPTTASPIPDVMSSNRAETPTPAEPTASSASQGAMAQGVQQAQQPQQTQQPQQAQGDQQQQQPSVTASKLPDVTRLTPEQKKQLLAQIDKQLASMPAPAVQQPTAPAPQPPAATTPTQSATADKMPSAVAPTQSATADKMPAPTTPAATAQQAVADKMQPAAAQQAVAAKMPTAASTAKTAKPKVPYSAIAQKAQPAKVSAARNPGAPTDAEYNKFQDLLKQALDKQGA
jgi:hypothetical protein